MEKVLDVYKRPYDQRFPVICMDESPRQLIDEVKMPIPGVPGRPERYDYEYKRNGVCNVFMSNEPLARKRMVKVTEKNQTGLGTVYCRDRAVLERCEEGFIQHYMVAMTLAI